jgi:diguanylate cyclase (GGDEF)-like protein
MGLKMVAGKKEKQLKILSAIAKLHSSIGVNAELEEIFRIVVEELAGIVKCAGCAVLLIEGDKIRIMAKRGSSKMLGDGEVGVVTPAMKYVIDTKQSLHTGDLAKSSAVGRTSEARSSKSLVYTPVLIDDQVRGIIDLDSPDKNAFGEEEVHFVELMAKGMAIALERFYLHSQVQVLTIKDSLTGCFNRKKLGEDLEDEVARAKRYHRPLSFHMIAVDSFEKYNDVHGQQKGDELLKKMADIFTRSVRNIDKVYRYGEEKFVILLPETTEENALLVARRLKNTIELESFEGEQESQPGKKITLSIGVASYPWDGEGKDELLKAAASALKRAKESGRKKQPSLERVK